MVQQATAPAAVQEQRLTMTYEEFLTKIDEGAHAEWVEGKAMVFMPSKVARQGVSTFLSGLISLYAALLDLGKVLAAPCEMLLIPGHVAASPMSCSWRRRIRGA